MRKQFPEPAMEILDWNKVSVWQSKPLCTPTCCLSPPSDLEGFCSGWAHGVFCLDVFRSSCQQRCEMNGAKCVFGTLVSPFCVISPLGISSPRVRRPEILQSFLMTSENPVSEKKLILVIPIST